MAQTNRVIRSINLDGENIRVDIFARTNGTYGFDEFRRNPEDGRDWCSIGQYGSKEFGSSEAALDAARNAFVWLNEAISD